jgi:hypothetical protein
LFKWDFYFLKIVSLLDEPRNKKAILYNEEGPIIKSIDLIENENGTENDFNFYDIRLDDESKKSMIY